MFETFVEFNYIRHRKAKPPPEGFEVLHTYKFKINKETYFVHAEQYRFNVFAIKFYPRSLKDSKDRYRKLTNKGNVQVILRTCINIMLDITKRFPGASLGFQGSESVGEDKEETKRFRIYEYIMKAFFPPAKFFHYSYPKYSIYLLINQASNSKGSIKEVEKMFWSIYDFGLESKDDQ